MYSAFIALALLAAPVFADLSVSSPTLTQCKQTTVSWQKGDGNYNMVVVPAGDVCAEPIHNLGDTTKTVLDWKVALPAGMKVVFSVIDSAGVEGFSKEITVEASDDDSCVPQAMRAAAKEAAKPSAPAPPPAIPSPPAAPATPPTVPSTPNTPVNPAVDPAGAGGAAPVAIGAANAGIDPFGANGAVSAGIATPLVALSALVAFFL